MVRRAEVSPLIRSQHHGMSISLRQLRTALRVSPIATLSSLYNRRRRVLQCRRAENKYVITDPEGVPALELIDETVGNRDLILVVIYVEDNPGPRCDRG